MRFALIAEGPADAPFVPVLTRLCRSLGADDVQGECINLHVGRKISNRVTALLQADPDIDLLFIHMDGDREGLDVRRGRIDDGMRQCGTPCPYVRLVPVRETETWLLVDAGLIRTVVGFPDGDAPLDLPKLSRVEASGEPKQKLKIALSRAKPRRKHEKSKGVIPPIDDREYARLRNELLENLDIQGPVTKLPAWQALVDDTRAALASLAQP